MEICRARYDRLGATECDSEGQPYKVAGPFMLRLVPDQPIYMFATPLLPEDRFARLFRTVWNGLPCDAVNSLIAHWAAGLKWRESPCPRIGVLGDWPGREGVAECTCLGHELLFTAWLVATQPDAGVAVAIAHELAHAWQFAVGIISGRSKSAIEREANMLSRKWLQNLEPLDCERPSEIPRDEPSIVRWNRKNKDSILMDDVQAESFWGLIYDRNKVAIDREASTRTRK